MSQEIFVLNSGELQERGLLLLMFRQQQLPVGVEVVVVELT